MRRPLDAQPWIDVPGDRHPPPRSCRVPEELGRVPAGRGEVARGRAAKLVEAHPPAGEPGPAATCRRAGGQSQADTGFIPSFVTQWR